MRFSAILIFAALFYGPLALSREIAFFQWLDARGKVIQLEPGGNFAHVAIRFQDRWLHAHPQGGVQLTPQQDLGRFGRLVVIASNPKVPDPTLAQVYAELYKKFDKSFDWDNPVGTYCSKLVAQFLGMKPTPMDFAAPYWNGHRPAHAGLGVSPDAVFRFILDEPGWSLHAQKDCVDEMRTNTSGPGSCPVSGCPR